MAVLAFSPFLHDRMRERRPESDHSFILIDEGVEVAQRHFASVIDQEEKVLQRKRNALAFLDSGVKMAVIAGRKVSDMTGVAVNFALMDGVAFALG